MQGRLDSITTSGFVEGWAHDVSRPLQPAKVSIYAEGAVVATGIANIYRWDLADANVGFGWCAFRLRVDNVSKLVVESRSGPERYSALMSLSLSSDAGGEGIEVFLAEANEPEINTLEMAKSLDPTSTNDVGSLRACHEVFATFIEARGLERFVRHAYLYATGLSPSSDEASGALARIRSASLTPITLLEELHATSNGRTLVAPTEPAFPFRLS